MDEWKGRQQNSMRETNKKYHWAESDFVRIVSLYWKGFVGSAKPIKKTESNTKKKKRKPQQKYRKEKELLGWFWV